MILAIERRTEVMEVIVSGSSAADARHRLVELVGVCALPAIALLDLQWRRVARLERGRIVEDRDRVRAEPDLPGHDPAAGN